MDQRIDDGPRGAASAHDHGGASIRAPAREGLAQVLHESIPVVVRAGQGAVRIDGDAGDGADAPGARIRMIDDAQRLFLVGNGEVAARKAKGGEGAQGLLQSLRLDGEGHIGSRQPIALEPVVVELWRARMHHGPAHDAGEQEMVWVAHQVLQVAQLASRNRVDKQPAPRVKSRGRQGSPTASGHARKALNRAPGG